MQDESQGIIEDIQHHLTESEIGQMLISYSNYQTESEVTEAIGVSQSAISRIRNQTVATENTG